MRLEIVQLPKPIHGAVAYSLGFRQGPAAPVRHAFGFGFQSRGNQCVSLLLIILGLASPAGLNLPERTDPGGAHALAPQGSGMAIDVIDGSNFQILLAGGRRQDQAAAQGHLLRRAGLRLPPDHLLQIIGGYAYKRAVSCSEYYYIILAYNTK